jgi:hypothetical protein
VTAAETAQAAMNPTGPITPPHAAVGAGSRIAPT